MAQDLGALVPGMQVLGRFTLRRELPASPDLWRWEATDGPDGAVVEVVAPRLGAALRPGADARFQRAQQTPPGPQALLGTLAVGRQGKLPVAARPSVQGAWPLDARLEAEDALALAAWLAPAIGAAAEALGEGLRPEDLVLDNEGVVRLAPCGLVEVVTVGRPPFWRAPETAPGGTADQAGALYGLGVILFRALTGQLPVAASAEAELRARQSSPTSLAVARPELPPALLSLVDGLLSPDPARRIAAVASLSPTPAPAKPTLAAPAPKAPVAPRRLSAPDAARDVALADYVVAVSPRGLNEAQRRKLAALGDAPTAALIAVAARGGLVPVAQADTMEQAQSRAAQVTGLGLPSTIVPTGWPMGRLILASGLGAAGAITLALGLYATVALAFGAVLVALAIALSVGVLRAISRSASVRSGRRALANAAETVRRSGPAGLLASRLSQARRQVIEASLPEPLRLDLLSAADDLEDRLDELSGLAGQRAQLDALSPLIDEIASLATPQAAESAEPVAARLALARAALAREG